MNKALKKISSKLHLWLGLGSGIIVFVIAITGCLWVFQEEVTIMIEGERIVEAQETSFISAEVAHDIAKTVFPDRVIHGTIFGQKTDQVEVVFYEADPEFYRSVFLNPYSGEILDVKNHREGFFWFVLQGHLYLWMPPDIGIQFTKYGTMIFVVLLLTGMILWWPKTKKAFKRSITFNWKEKTKWKKKNYDLHNILGFYSSSLAFLIAYTGLIMAFGWVAFLTYKALGGDKSPQFITPDNVSEVVEMVDDGEKPINKIVPMLRTKYPNYDTIELHYPENDTSSILVEMSTKEGVYYDTEYLFYDQYTMEELETTSIYGKTENAGFADRVMRMYYDIHVGAIGGLPGKIIAFFISLLTASLPVTGFLFWYGRSFKS
ncbi:PepSY-associated TM helix domain-containing protein [Gracilimonas sp.]|uniref:PepSY-associated TM helix domain-containing protein n=1 Tax=Gracilimonas sp. TaxID=1974203 RepID=UPI003BAC1F86